MSARNPQAVQLNETIRMAHPAVLDMLSAKGKSIYFPKLGILSQAAEAKGKAINATIGTALEEDNSPMCLPSIRKQISLPSADVFPYAPSPGLPDIRKHWATMMMGKNPGLQGKTFSQPVVTCALTHGLSMAGYLFGGDDDVLILPDLYWENYDLLFTVSYGIELAAFKTFAADGTFNVAGLSKAIADRPEQKLLVSLNFPNNPTGYTPLDSEIPQIVKCLKDAAEGGKKLVVLIDDAYFGLVFEKGVYRQSIFADLCDAHENILAVKIDGPTKEDYVWGLRVGFITFGIKGGTPELYQALEAKCAGAIRGNISNVPMHSQSMLLNAYRAETYAKEKDEKFNILQARCRRIRQILADHPEYADEFVALPFNSGYFMCVKPVRVNSELLRQALLSNYSTGVIALGNVIRVAFSSTPLDQLDPLFANIYNACRAL